MKMGAVNVETEIDMTAVTVETTEGYLHVGIDGTELNALHVEMPAEQPRDVHEETAHTTTPMDINNTHHDMTSSPTPATPKGGNKISIRPVKFQLKPLVELETDVWCNKISEYHNFSPPPLA